MYIYIYIYICIYKKWTKKRGHLQKCSQFGITVTGRTEIKENRIFLECFLGNLIKKLLTF